MTESKIEWHSGPSPRKKFKKDDSNKQHNSHRKSLLSLFIEYAWGQNSIKNSVCENLELTYCSRTQYLKKHGEFWLSSSTLDVQIASMIALIDSAKVNKICVLPFPTYTDEMKWAEIGYSLKEVLLFLISCDDNLNYVDDDGRTILHVLLEGYLEITKNLSEVQLSSMQNFIIKLLTRGASLYSLNKSGNSPLHVAARCKNKQILEAILFFLADVKMCDENGNTALHIVVDNCVDEELAKHKDGYVDIVRTLVSEGADINAKNNKGLTAVHLATEKFHVEMLKFFADSGSVDFDQSIRKHDLHLFSACKSSLTLNDTTKMIETIDFLVSQIGCNLDQAIDSNGFMPLHYAAELGRVEIVERLIDLGANVDCQAKQTLMTPLYLASKNDRLDVMRKLVEAGADINARAADDTTPIFMSVLLGNVESMQYLIDQGADLYRRDKLTGFELIHAAAYGYEPEEPTNVGTASEPCKLLVAEKQKRKKFDVIIDNDFDLNDPGTCGIVPLQLAVLSSNVNAVKTLIEHGANLNFQRDMSDFTALHIASLNKNLEMVKILIEAGADVNCRGGIKKWTPLHLVSMVDLKYTLGKYPDNVTAGCRKMSALNATWPKYDVNSTRLGIGVMELLIKNGADVNAKDTSGKSPIHFATFRNDYGLTKILVDAGAHVDVQDNEGQLPLSNALKANQLNTLIYLLYVGADINEYDISQQVLERNENDKLKKLCLEHTLKFKLLGYPIVKNYEPSIQKFVYLDPLHLEIDALKKHRIGNVSLYQFLQMNVKDQYHFAEEIFNSYESIKKLSPVYCFITHGVCCRAVNRKSLLESARIAWTQVSHVYLPYVCVENILSHLNNRYLEVLIDSAKVDEKVLIDEGKVCVLNCSIGKSELE